MPEYRACIIGLDGHVLKAVEIICDDDSAAVKKAEVFLWVVEIQRLRQCPSPNGRPAMFARHRHHDDAEPKTSNGRVPVLLFLTDSSDNFTVTPAIARLGGYYADPLFDALPCKNGKQGLDGLGQTAPRTREVGRRPSGY